MPEFHSEPYIYLPAVSHKSALIAWGAFYFRTNDLDHVVTGVEITRYSPERTRASV